MATAHQSRRLVLSVSALVLLIGGMASAARGPGDLARGSQQILACVAKGDHALTWTRSLAKCPKGSRKLAWNQTGPQGPQGAPGVKGDRGVPGPPGVTNQTTGEKDMPLSTPAVVPLFSVQLSAKQAAGGTVNYTITADDGGTQFVTEHGTIQWLATPASVTCTVDASDRLHFGTVNSSCSPGFFNPGSRPGVSIFDDVSFPSAAPIVHHHVVFTIINDSNAPMRLQ